MEQADQVLYNGVVRTMDDRGTVAEAIALAGNRIVAVGDSAAMRALAAPGASMRDLRGRCVLPGLVDSHNHLLQTGLNVDAVDLAPARSVADVVDAIRQRARQTPPDAWVLTSSRWHETQLAEQRFPTRRELDAAVPAHPVLIRRGGHNLVVNSLALRLGGVDESTPDPPGGTYVRRDGVLTGHIIGAPAHAPVVSKVPPPDEARMVAAIRNASARYAAAGLTGVIEPGLTPDQIDAFRHAEAEGALAVRTVLMERISPGHSSEERVRVEMELSSRAAVQTKEAGSASTAPTILAVDTLPESPRPPHPAPDTRHPALVSIGGIKIVADGGVETNYLREPYAFADDPTAPRGKPQVSLENLTAVCRWAMTAHRQLGIHCVGDAAIDLVLDAFEAAVSRIESESARTRHPAPGTPHSLRWTLIHMILAHPEQMVRARALGLVLAVQQPLIYALGAGWLKYWGPERAARAMPMRLYAESGLPVGGGSDSPVTPYQPLLGIWSSVTRATEFAGVLGPEWGCTVEQALQMYTRGSAHCSFDEHQRGQLAPGFLADLTVLAADPLAVPVDDLRHIPVELTLVDGDVVYEG